MFNFFRRSVDTILADFRKVHDRLSEFEDRLRNEADMLQGEITKKLQEKEAKVVEAARASKAAAKMREILGDA